MAGTPCTGHSSACQQSQKPVAAVLYGTAPVFPDLRLDQLPEMRLQPFVRHFLIGPHQARVPRQVGGEDGCEAADGPGEKLGLTKSTPKQSAALASRYVARWRRWLSWALLVSASRSYHGVRLG